MSWYLSLCLSESITYGWWAWERDSGSFFLYVLSGDIFYLCRNKVQTEAITKWRMWAEIAQSAKRWALNDSKVLQQGKETWKILTKGEQDFHMTGFLFMFLLPWIPIAIFKISYLLCGYSQSWHLPVLAAVLRQVEQGKMQQIADIGAMRSLYCDNTCNCVIKLP